MISAFKTRKPAAAILVTLIFGPMIGMFYLGKGRMGIAYLLAGIAVLATFILILHLGIADISKTFIPIFTMLPIRIVGAGHSYILSKSSLFEVPKVWFSRWHSIIVIWLALNTALPFIIPTFLWEPFNIPSSSMLPTLLIGDELFVSKYSYGYSRHSINLAFLTFSGRLFFTEPQRGDIAVYRTPIEPDINRINRIIGLPGDQLQMINGILHLNGKAVSRRKTETYTYTDSMEKIVSTHQFVESLPNDRHYSILEESDFEFFDNTPVFTVPAGHYFGMGDNRDNSLDSRSLEKVGYIPVEYLVGKLSIIYWNEKSKRMRFLD